MSLQRLGVTKATVGSWSKAAGHALQGWFAPGGRLVNAAQGECFWAYSPRRQPVNPGAGRLSE
jgi:hypothetical protein